MSQANERPPFSGLLYAGSYGGADDETIHVCAFDGESGKLSVLQRVSGLENASFLALHPDGRRLYAVSETGTTEGAAGGSVVAYDIDDATGLLGARSDRFLTHGAHPCYISADAEGRALFVANYTGGNVAALPLTAEGMPEAAASVHAHEGELGPNTARQDTAHAHSIMPLGETGWLVAADLGLDAVVVYRYDAESRELARKGSCKVRRGAGPRHLAYHGELRTAYVLNELDSTVTVLKLDAGQGTLTAGQTVPALPSGYNGRNDAADLHLAPSGRFLYSSNRGHDSIAAFAVDPASGELTPIQHIHCGGETPRNFAITPDGRYLLAAHQKTGTVATFRIDGDSGLLSPTGQALKLPSPVCLTFGRAHSPA
ncbi:lactonase family protein [Paenibacillus arenilitoris]|uniref:Lactonase family protein n=1 Tax=Paenibacillus arenilitoris TaxID=2772299 RepID=A0A927CI31_9BACL|nr:lactonase family protein [Paenibacillus arenilitoris]MBD2867900.1 lactonase family protein [Paenibacillus arenilitoris]